MDYVKIGGKSYDVIVTDIERNFEILQSSNAGATLAPGARETLDPLGTRIGHKITFKRKPGYEKEFDELWDFVIQPRFDGVWVDIVYNQDILNYEARFTSGSQQLKKIDPVTKKVYWGELVLDIVPLEAQVKPI